MPFVSSDADDRRTSPVATLSFDIGRSGHDFQGSHGGKDILGRLDEGFASAGSM